MKLKEHDIDMRLGPRLIGVVMIRGMGLRCNRDEELISRVDMGLEKHDLLFPYCYFINIGPCQCVIPWGL